MTGRKSLSVIERKIDQKIASILKIEKRLEKEYQKLSSLKEEKDLIEQKRLFEAFRNGDRTLVQAAAYLKENKDLIEQKMLFEAFKSGDRTLNQALILLKAKK